LSDSHLKQLYRHADECLPLESVALLFGHTEESMIRVTRIELLQNSADSRVRFAVEPEEQYRLLVEAEERGEELACVFHSHPAPPKPSATDLRYMRLNPVVWLIASKLTGSWKSLAYILDGESVTEVTLVSDE
jgi:proteasome lid subunit RPN8/RPN11